MFNNIGRKIKGLAEIICVLGIIASVFIGLGLKNASAGLTFLIVCGGSLLSWIGSFVLYGFGELVDTAMEMKEEIINIRTSLRFLSSKISADPPKTEHEQPDTYNGVKL